MQKILKVILFLIISIILLNGITNSSNAYTKDTGGGFEVDVVTLPNPLPGSPTPQTLIGKVINAVLGIVGSLALLMFIYGGFTWMTAAGNEQSVTKGKDILIWATVGLIVIFSAYALVKFVFTGIGAT